MAKFRIYETVASLVTATRIIERDTTPTLQEAHDAFTGEEGTAEADLLFGDTVGDPEYSVEPYAEPAEPLATQAAPLPVTVEGIDPFAVNKLLADALKDLMGRTFLITGPDKATDAAMEDARIALRAAGVEV